VIPRELLGTFFGAQSAAFNGFAGVSAVAAGIVLDRLAGPGNFSLCFALTFVFMACSFFFLSLTREPQSLPPQEQHSSALLNKSISILRSDRNFRAFLGVRILSQFGGMAFAFYLIYAVQQYGMSDAAAGVMVAILLIGQVVLSPVMGRLGDRWSHRGVMSFGAIGAALSAVLAWKATSVQWFYAIFLLEAVAVVALWTIPLALSVAFAHHEEERPLYIGMSNTLPAPAAILAPVFGGWLADIAGFHTMFIVSAVCALCMAAALWFVVKDPKRRMVR
jgi:MFS family permease